MARVVRWLLGLFGLIVGGSIVLALGSAVAAAMARRRMTSTGDTASDEFSIAGIFDEARYTSTAPRLRTGRLIAWFGAAVVDLRQATLDPAGATIDARAAWGGASVVVPRTWRVRMTTRALFGGGGTDVSDDGLPADAPTLDVRALALFGGVSVTGRPMAEADAPMAEADAPMAEADAPMAEADAPMAEADAPTADAVAPTADPDREP